MNVDVAMTFLDFVEERHRVWSKRQAGQPQPWSDDPVLATRKFTNVFRWLDPGSQFVITDLFEEGLPDEDFLLRCFLYRHTNLPSAWRAFREEFADYPTRDNLDDVEEFWLDYKADGSRVFSGAYMIYPQSSVPGTDKVVSIVGLTRNLFVSGKRVCYDFMNARSQSDRFAALRTNKGVADFMSMQILTDFGYSTEFRENDFVVPGPGARKGAAALDMEPMEAVLWAHGAVQSLGIEVLGRSLSRMDVQNCLCEFSKYVRFAAKPSPQQLYAPAHAGVQFKPVLPPNWQP